MKLRIALVFLPCVVLIIMSIHFLLAGDGRKAEQIVGDEICVNYICYKGAIKLAVVRDSVLYLNRAGKTLVIPIQKVVIIKGHYFYHFEYDRGFMTVGPHDKVVFIFYDKDNIVIHIKHSTYRQE